MLKLEHIQKSFDGAHILNGLPLKVPNGEVVSTLGSSGSGKTTLLNPILGITEVGEGRILFNEQDMAHAPIEQRGFNIVFQDYASFPNLTALGDITYGLENKPRASSPEEVQELVHLLGLEEHLEKRIDQLSRGQKQYVTLVRTLAMKPKILLLDEPLNALDGVIRESIKERTKMITKEHNLTIVIVTHDSKEVSTLSDRVLVINESQISQYEKPEDVMNQPSCNFVQDFILNQSEIKRRNIFILFHPM